MFYLIKYYDDSIHEIIVPDFRTMMNIASKLEKSKNYFKVYNSNVCLTQQQFGCNNFEYWLKDEQTFSGNDELPFS